MGGRMTGPTNLTLSLIETLDYIDKVIKKKKELGETPIATIRDIEEISNGRMKYNMASIYLSRLVKLGYVKRVARGVYILTDKGREVLEQMR